jgi:RimJ/RimL family protein N-acetyltransferase
VLENVLPRLLKLDESCTSMGFWAAIERASGSFVGWFHLRPSAGNLQETELGYRLKRVYWGRGFATEGSIALIDKGFRELGVAKVVATTMALNVRSRRVLEKAGLQLEMTFVYPGDPFPGWPTEDCMEVKYGLTRERWALSPRQ